MSEPNKENARLRAELAEYHKLFDKYDGGAEGLALHISTNEQLRAENAAAKADKERLDWLASHSMIDWPYGCLVNVHCQCRTDKAFISAPSLREVIDSARALEETKP